MGHGMIHILSESIRTDTNFLFTDGVRRNVHISIQPLLHIASRASTRRVRAGCVGRDVTAIPEAIRARAYESAVQ